MKGLRFFVSFLAVAALLLSLGVSAQDKTNTNPLQAEALVLAPPAAAAPVGNWSYIQPYGYMWMPAAMTGINEAEWAPWDPWWAMPYGHWAWAQGYGWGWTPMIPPHSASPLGWGFDSWYGGWYGFTPDGNPSNTMWEYGTDQSDKDRAQAWVNRHGGSRQPHQKTSQVRIATVVAAPPPSLAPPVWRSASQIDKIQDEQAAQGKGYAQHRDRGDRQHGQGHAGGHQGQGHGGGRTEPGRGSAPPAGISGGGGSAAPSSSGQHKTH